MTKDDYAIEDTLRARIAELEALLRDDPELRLCRQYIALLEALLREARDYAVGTYNGRRTGFVSRLDAALTPESLLMTKSES